MNVKYDRVVCITLDKRPEKWKAFLEGIPEDFPFGEVERYSAIDGTLVTKPTWWNGGGGAWGCYCSHRRIIEECLNDPSCNSVLIFEDDALFLPDFTKNVIEFHNNLPDDAQWVYYGGQYLKQAVKTPVKINECVYRPYNVNRTHAYGILTRKAMSKIYQHINRLDWTTTNHIDHHYGRIHQDKSLNVYCPSNWLVDQRAGRSDVAFKDKTYTHWKDASSSDIVSPFIAVLGCHSSGSSALAGALYHLGVHLGNSLVGFYGKPPINGGEAVKLVSILEETLPVPMIKPRVPRENTIVKLDKFINEKRREAKSKNTIAALKYPQLAFFGKELVDIVGKDSLKFIVCARDLDESITSLHKRFSGFPKSAIAEHQTAIQESIKESIKTIDPSNVLTIDYTELLTNTVTVIDSLISFCGLTSISEDQRNAAIAYINPDLRHINHSHAAIP